MDTIPEDFPARPPSTASSKADADDSMVCHCLTGTLPRGDTTFGLAPMACGYAEIYRGALTKYACPTTRPRDLPG